MKTHLLLARLASASLLFLACLSFAWFAVIGSTVASTTASAASLPVRLRLDFDRPLLPADSSEKIVLKVCLDGLGLPPQPQHRPPVNLALVIDRSGSMSGDKIAKAREAALEIVRRLAPDDVFSLVAYDTRVTTLIPARRVGRGHERFLEESILGISAGGNTALYGGVCSGAREVRHHLGEGNFSHRIILLSDGQANVGPSATEDLARLGRSLGSEGIPVTTVGLGLGFNEDLMTRLAQMSDGNTYFAAHSTDLPRIFQEELGDARRLIARRVVVEIDFQDGVRPLRFVGREGRIEGSRATLEIGHLYGGQERFALIEVELRSGPAGAARDIAIARARFEDLEGRRLSPPVVSGSLRFTADASEVRARANAQVQADYAANLTALAREEAIRLSDAGKPAAAAEVLKSNSDRLFSIGSSYSNIQVLSRAKASAEDSARLERDGLDNNTRKIYRAENAQTKNQQYTK